jgi:thiol reductant ABC exporter CydC subunit
MTALLALAWPHRGRLALSTLAAFATLASGLGLLATSGYLISRAALRPPVLELAVAIAAVRTFGLARALFRYAERVVSHDVALRLLAALRSRLYRHLERLAPAGLDAFRSADLLARLVADVDALQDLFVRTLVPPLAAALALLAALGLFWPISAPAGAVLAAAVVLGGAGLPVLARRAVRAPARALAASRAELSVRLVELLQSAPEVAVLGTAPRRLAAVAVADRALMRAGRRLAASAAVVDGGTIALSGLACAAVLWVVVPPVAAGHVDGVLLATLVLAALAAFEAVQPLAPALQKLEESREPARRLREIESAPAPVADPSAPVRAEPGPLVLEDAWLRYSPDAAWALAGASLRLEPGCRVALTGPSGCGKTTVAMVLARFRQLDRGRATLNGRDLAEHAQDDVRRVVGLCAQDAHLFDTTIAANIRLARPEAPIDEVEEAARRAHLLDFVRGLPEGFETRVGEMGARLSGGQRQRIALARTLLAGFPIVLLDEPTANLDQRTAAAVLDDIWSALEGRTVLLITHRPEGLDAVDEVLRMEAGRIVS